MVTTRERRLRIGVFIEWISDGYSDPILEEIISYAKQRDVDIRCFVGGFGPLDFPVPTRHVPFHYSSSAVIDGAIVVSMGNFATTSQLEQMFSRLDPLPMCGMAVKWERYPGVEIDNYNCVRAGISHLIQKHGRRRIACVRGPLTSAESEQRFLAYQDTLAEFGIPYDEQYTVAGFYMRDHGENAVRVLLDERQLAFDAIVTANDAMALGVLDELKRRRIAVPQEVSLLGFDDIDDARHARPPLSTVRQPIREQARQAFDQVLFQIEGRPIDRRVVVDSKLVLRRSCGCVSSRGWLLSSHPPPASSSRRRGGIQAWVEESARTLAKFILADRELAPELEQNLASKISEAVSVGAKGPFLELLDSEFARLSDRGDLLMLLPMLDSRRKALNSVAASDIELSRLDELLRTTASLASEAAESFQAQKRYSAKAQINRLLRLNEALMQTTDVAELAEVLAEQLPHLGVRGCFACVWEGAQVPATWARLVFSCHLDRVTDLPDGGLRFPASDVLPISLGLADTKSDWLISPSVLGPFVSDAYVVLICEASEPFVNDSLVIQIAANLKRLDLMGQIKEANAQLETMANTDALTRLSNRRHLVARFEVEFERAKRYGLGLSCAIVDIDHFKHVNDTYGHLGGDGVLQQVAAVLAGHSRQSDLVGRYGGEEFCIVLTHTKLEDAVLVAEKARRGVSALEFSEGETRFRVTASFGVTEIQPEDQTIEDMVRRADLALYRAKDQGRNRVEKTPS